MALDTCIFGDCRDIMRQLIADDVKVQTCVTSPPYWGLRDYGVEGQLGLEASPADYVANMVEVFSLVRDLLTDDGTLWLNLGDSYAGSGRGGHVSNTSTLQGSIEHEQECRKARGSQLAPGFHAAAAAAGAIGRAWVPPPAGLKQKDLVGIPWRVAFALQTDGWYLRSDIIWHKPNPMPESVTDRPTKSHEYLFLLAKTERYYYDADAIAEISVTNDPRRPYGSPGANSLDPRNEQGAGKLRAPANRKRGEFNGKTNALKGREAFRCFTERRNRRSVWTVATEPYDGAHFATFPPSLIEPCVLAGSRPDDIVFDPFFGSGTTGQVAQSLGRHWIGCELNPAYAELQKHRTAQQGLAL